MLQILVERINNQPSKTPEKVVSSEIYDYKKTRMVEVKTVQKPKKKVNPKRKSKQPYRESKNLSDLSKVYNRFDIKNLKETSLEYLAELKSIKDGVQADFEDLGIIKTLNRKLAGRNINEMILAESQEGQTFRSLMVNDLHKIIKNELEKSTKKDQQLFFHSESSFDITTKLIIYSAGNKLQELAKTLETLPKRSTSLDHKAYAALIDKAYKEFQLSSTDCIMAINYLANLIRADGSVAISGNQSNEEKLNTVCSHIRVFLLTLNKNL